jgi:hypothetical protein
VTSVLPAACTAPPRKARVIRVDAEHGPDLLWAVRGGGGMGVVTALEMRLYGVRELYAGSLFFPFQRAAEVLHAWRGVDRHRAR